MRGLRDTIAVGVARALQQRRLATTGMHRRGSQQLLHIGHWDHAHTTLLAFGAPPLILWLVQNDQDLPLLEGQVLVVVAREVVQRAYIFQVLLGASNLLQRAVYRWEPLEGTGRKIGGFRRENGAEPSQTPISHLLWGHYKQIKA